jgi:hypothetical protein
MVALGEGLGVSWVTAAVTVTVTGTSVVAAVTVPGGAPRPPALLLLLLLLVLLLLVDAVVLPGADAMPFPAAPGLTLIFAMGLAVAPLAKVVGLPPKIDPMEGCGEGTADGWRVGDSVSSTSSTLGPVMTFGKMPPDGEMSATVGRMDLLWLNTVMTAIAIAAITKKILRSTVAARCAIFRTLLNSPVSSSSSYSLVPPSNTTR